MFGLTFEKLLIIGVIAAFIIGPDRLPTAAEKLAQAVRWFRGQATDARERLRDEMGEEFDEVDWRKLDPRQYDPRRIIRDALLEDLTPAEREAARRAGAMKPGDALAGALGVPGAPGAPAATGASSLTSAAATASASATPSTAATASAATTPSGVSAMSAAAASAGTAMGAASRPNWAAAGDPPLGDAAAETTPVPTQPAGTPFDYEAT